VRKYLKAAICPLKALTVHSAPSHLQIFDESCPNMEYACQHGLTAAVNGSDIADIAKKH
jgi:hypothetical protein